MRAAGLVAVIGGLLWATPMVLVETPLRDQPLRLAFAGIDGQITSGGAAWNWLGPIEYRTVALADHAGRTVALVPRLVIDRGLVGLALDSVRGWIQGGPLDLGTVRLVSAEVLVEVSRGGSGIENILAPWLAATSHPIRPEAATTPPRGVRCGLEVIDATVELVDLDRDDSWRVTDLLAAFTIDPDSATLHGWTAAGRVQHGGQPSAAITVRDLPPTVDPRRMDRTTITAGATAALAREGGWAVSSPAQAAVDEPRMLALAANRLPLGVSNVVASRFMATYVLDGLADARLDITLPAEAAAEGSSSHPLQVVGSVSGVQLSVRTAESLEQVAVVGRCEMPLDLVVNGDLVTIRDLRAISPLFKAEASGRLRMPRSGSWEWGEALVGENFAVAADIDLTAAAGAIPGGLTVRPDVKVTGGQLQLTAASRPDGPDRVLEVRLTSRDLSAVQHAVDGERPLRWNDPFTAWFRGRRGPNRGDRLWIEEARVASPAVEIAATGTVDASSVQWTVDIDKLVTEAAEVLDLGPVALRGAARGTLELSNGGAAGGSTARLSAAFTDFSLSSPGRRAWSDKEITLKAEGVGSPAGAAWLIDDAEAEIIADGDRFKATLAGGAIVDPRAIVRSLAGSAVATVSPWLRTAPDAEAVSVDCSLAGDLGRWQPRVESFTGGSGVTLGGTIVQAAGAVTARGNAWQITRANVEIEKLTAKPDGGGWRIEEPRLVASAAGVIDPAAGLVEVSSAELLTASLSLRTGGATLATAARSIPAASGLLDRIRGKVQWQADVGRLEKWIVPPAAAARWPASGRAWGTAEILDTPAGLNLLVEVTGNQLAVARGAAGTPLAGGAAPPQTVWAEPRASLVVEVTRPLAGDPAATDSLTINRFALESSTLAVTAAGSVSEIASRGLLDLGGTVAYDWSQMSRLLTPWTGGGVQLVGGGPRPFAVRGPLGSAWQLAGGTDTGPREPMVVPLPDAWLDKQAGDQPRARAITLPVSPAAKPSGLSDMLRQVSVETSTTWAAADLGGLRLDPGEMSVRLFEGQLAFGPFDIGAAGGRLRGAPWIKLMPPPGELVVPPGRLVDRVRLSSDMCDRWVRWLVPMLGRATHTEGLVSVDVAGGRIPLGDPFAGEMSGQIFFEQLEMTPSGTMQPLVNLIVKLQSVLDPRFAFGDKAVLMRVRPEPVRVRLAERRLWHEGLMMDTGQLTIQTKGSVGADGSLAMVAELAFRGDLAGQTPVIAQLLRTPLVKIGRAHV